MKKNKGQIYLSGGMEKTSADDPLGAKWRAKTAERLIEMGYFPIDITELDIAYQKIYGDVYHMDMDNNNETSLYQRKANIRKHFIHTDLKLITDNSDALIVYYDESVRYGAGTIGECQVAFNNDIPIFIVSKWEDWLNEIPGWLHALSTRVFTSFEDLYDYMIELPDGILKPDMYGNRGAGDYYLCSLSGKVFHKSGSNFVSKVSPLYSKDSVDIVKHTNEKMACRYDFFIDLLEKK